MTDNGKRIYQPMKDILPCIRSTLPAAPATILAVSAPEFGSHNLGRLSRH
jgi:hypothetical protein